MGHHAVVDLSGQRFTSLLVLSRDGSGPNGHALWRCRCDCGKERSVSGVNLRRGDAKSCGCKIYIAEARAERLKNLPPKQPRKDLWTEERVALLRELYPKGLSASQIAARLGYVTRNAVIGKATRLGLTKRKAKPATDQKTMTRPTRKQFSQHTVLALREVHAAMKAAEPLPAPTKTKRTDIREPKPLMIPLLDLLDHHCRWPFDVPDRAAGEDSFLFCGHDREKGSSYCPAHAVMARPPAAKRKAA